jgi:hypothetical protein
VLKYRVSLESRLSKFAKSRKELLEILKPLFVNEANDEWLVSQVFQVVLKQHSYFVDSQLAELPEARNELEKIEVVDKRFYEFVGAPCSTASRRVSRRGGA